MSYFSQLIQRNDRNGPLIKTQPVAPLKNVKKENSKEVENPFDESVELHPDPVNRPIKLLEEKKGNIIHYFQSEHVNPPRVLSDKVENNEQTIHKEVIINKITSNVNDSKSPSKEMNDLHNLEPRENVLKEKYVDNKIIEKTRETKEKIILSPPEQEITPVFKEEKKQKQPLEENKKLKNKEKNKTNTTELKPVSEKKKLKPGIISDKKEGKTFLQPDNRKSVKIPVKNQVSKNNLHIGKITVEVIQPASSKITKPAKTNKRRSRKTNIPVNNHKLRYNNRFGLGQL